MKVTSDLKIREAYFSDGGQAHLRLANDVELLVIRLGLSSPNKATSAALYEVLAVSEDSGVPVWLVESAARPFNDKHPSWSPDIEAQTEGWPRVDLVTEENDPKNISVDDLAALANEGN